MYDKQLTLNGLEKSLPMLVAQQLVYAEKHDSSMSKKEKTKRQKKRGRHGSDNKLVTLLWDPWDLSWKAQLLSRNERLLH